MDRSNIRPLEIQSSQDKGKTKRRLLLYPLSRKSKKAFRETLLKIKIMDIFAGIEKRQNSGYWKLLQGQERQHTRSHS